MGWARLGANVRTITHLVRCDTRTTTYRGARGARRGKEAKEKNTSLRALRSLRFAFQHGFTLMEAIFALGIIAVGLLALLGAFVHGMTLLASSQPDFIAKEKAAEAIESVYAARDTHVLTWAQLRNVVGQGGAGGGVFLDGPQLLREPGPDGLVNTADDAGIQRVVTPGPDNVLGTADDVWTALDGYTREIQIRDEGLNLRRVTVTVTYRLGSLTRHYVVTTLISSFA